MKSCLAYVSCGRPPSVCECVCELTMQWHVEVVVRTLSFTSFF